MFRFSDHHSFLAARVWVWLVALLLWQVEMTLALRATAVVLLLGLAWWRNQLLLMRLLRGIRWLVLSLLLLFGWLTPGTAILPYAVAVMPTYEGLWWGAEHLLMLVGLVAWVVVWFWWVPPSFQVEALVRAFGWLPCAVVLERFAVRLALVLTEFEALGKKNLPLTDWRQLARWLAGDGQSGAER